MNKIKKCRVCGSADLVSVFRLGKVALSGLFPNDGDFVREDPLNLVKCNTPDGCQLVQLENELPLSEYYGENYGYRSGLNPSMVSHLKEIVSLSSNYVKIDDGLKVLDIGSNDGTLLNNYSNKKITKYGVDPTAIKFSQYYNGDVNIIPKFFNPQTIIDHEIESIDIVTSISMFYDLEDPVEFAKSICNILTDDGIWVLEQSDLSLMIKNLSFDTICHEHISYYSFTCIKYILKKAGLKIIHVEQNATNGGSFLYVVCKNSSKLHNPDSTVISIQTDQMEIGIDDLSVWNDFNINVTNWRKKFTRLIQKLKSEGKTIAGLGASTKGNILLSYLGLNHEDISVIGEVNPFKFGKYTPGSNIPIRKEDQVLLENYDYYVILPWHFKQSFLDNPKYKNKKLIFPLPEINIYGNTLE